jgi:hypothetical protein
MALGAGTDPTSDDVTWNGRWCWPVDRLPRPWNTYAYFRRSIDLPDRPTSAVVRISADARYTLFVNGRRVHQGPARCFPHLQSYDTLDLADFLTAGLNAVCAVVHQFGVPTAQSAYRDATGFLLDGRVETNGGSIDLHTPTDWLCREAGGWRKHVARLSADLGFQEHFDADADPPDWLAPEYVASAEAGWRAPVVVAPVGGHPWVSMQPRGVPLLADELVPFAAVVGQFGGENARGYKVAEDVYHLPLQETRKKVKLGLSDPDAMLRNDDRAATLAPPPDGQFHVVVLDLGRVHTAHVVLDLSDAHGDEIVDVLYVHEVDKSGAPVLAAGETALADRYRCRPGAQRWETFWPKGFRYVALIFRNVEHPLAIRHVGARSVGASLDAVSTLETSDERLNAIFRAGVDTLRACALDALVDEPSGRQAQELSAVLAQARSAACVFGDVSLLERAVDQAAQGQGSDGSILGRPPADDPRGRSVESMFAWAGGLWEHYLHTGARDLLARFQPALDRLLDFLGRRERLEGLIGGLEGFDAPSREADVSRRDFSALVNLGYLQTLRWSAEIYDVLGFEKEGAWASKKGEALERAIEKHFWDAKAKVLRDGFDPAAGAPVEQTSVYANALAMTLGLKPDTREAQGRDVILKSMSARRSKVVVPPPTSGGVVLDALVEAGLRGEAMALIRARWGAMVDRGATTFGAQWDGAAGGTCNGASAAPARVLLQLVLGVTAAEPGWKRVRVAPVPGDLEFARGTVMSPAGPIRVEWEKVGEDQLAVRVELPEGVEGEFSGPLGESRALGSGASEFNT